MKTNELKIRYFLGYYKPNDYYFAHLVEHYLAVYFRGGLGINVISANCGSGFILIGIQSGTDKVQVATSLINSRTIDRDTVLHEKEIIISENLFRNRMETFRDIYEALETNSGDQNATKKLFDQFKKLSDNILIKKVFEVFSGIVWKFIDEKDLADYAQKNIELPKNKELKFNFLSKCSNNVEFAYTEIDLVFKIHTKLNDFFLDLISEEIAGYLNSMVRVFSSHKISTALIKASNQRMVLHYSGFMPGKYQKEFFAMVKEKYEQVSLDQELVEKARISYLHYLSNRTPEEIIYELAEFGYLSQGPEADKKESLSMPNYIKRYCE